MNLYFITKANSKDEGTQTYLYTQQPGNPSNEKQITNYKQLQNQLQQVAFYRASNNEIEASFIEHTFEEDVVLIVLLSLPA